MARKKIADKRQLSLLDLLDKDHEFIETLVALKAIAKSDLVTWRGFNATPPGSVLEKLITVFRTKTDVALEIPFFTMIHFVSARLLAQNVVMKMDSDIIRPDIWGIVLASSGASKSWTKNKVRQATGLTPNFPDCAGPAAFVEALADNNNGFYVRDEMGKFIKNIETQSHMMELKDLLLRVKDGDEIVRKTKKSVIKIEKPALTILGFGVIESFIKELSAESLLDGFGQRFSFIIAQDDPSRPPGSHPLYEISLDEIAEIRHEWDKMCDSITHKEYTITTDAKKAFVDSFKAMFENFPNIPHSFVRRIMFRSFPYSLIYHVILNKKSDEIDAVDMAWAGRLCAIQLKDTATLLADHQVPDLERILSKATEVVAKVRAKGLAPTPRDIARGVYGVKSASDAQKILQLVL